MVQYELITITVAQLREAFFNATSTPDEDWETFWAVVQTRLAVQMTEKNTMRPRLPRAQPAKLSGGGVHRVKTKALPRKAKHKKRTAED